MKAFDTLSPDFPAKQLHLICTVSPIAVHGSVGFFFLPQHCYHLQILSFCLFNMFLNYTGKKCQLIVFFSLYFLGKTGHSYKEALDFPHILEHHHHYHSTGPLWPPHSIKMLTQFPAVGGFCQNITLPNFDPKYQQHSLFL